LEKKMAAAVSVQPAAAASAAASSSSAAATAAAAVAASAAKASAASPPKTVDQLLDEALRTHSFGALIAALDRKEVEDPAPPQEAQYVLHLLSLLNANDMTNARHLWRRIPKESKKNAGDIGLARKILQPLYRKEYGQFFVAAEAGTKDMSAKFRPLVAQLRDTVRARNERLIGSVYTSISLQNVVDMCGLNAMTGGNKQQIADYVTNTLRWRLDKDFVVPTRVQVPKEQTTSYGQLHALSNHIMYLEDK